jgi:hypothetical protein
MCNTTTDYVDAAKKMRKAAQEMGLMFIERPAFGVSGYTSITIGPFGARAYPDVRDALLGRDKP